MALRVALDNFALPHGQPSAKLATLSLGEVGENVLRRRLKRREAVAIVERSPEYLQAKHLVPGFDKHPPTQKISPYPSVPGNMHITSGSSLCEAS